MCITEETKDELRRALGNKMIELREGGVTHIKQYEIAFQDAIESVFPNMCWWQVTDCEIFMHLLEHKDPISTMLAILKGLKED